MIIDSSYRQTFFSVFLNRLFNRLSIIENYHTVSLAPIVTDNMGSSKSTRVCQESSLEIIKSGSTDSTELIGSICNGQAGCSWDDSIADQIKDPCSDVFKYMSVEYNCAVPAPPQRQNDSGFSGDFNESGGECYAAMMAAYEYYSNVLGVVKSSRSHGDTFIGYNGPLGNGRHANRMDMFKFNMKKWGNKLDDQNCECPLKYTSAISTAFDQNKPIAGLKTVEDKLTEMADNFTCNRSSAVYRKVRHAHQIIKGTSPNGDGAGVAKRQNRFNQF